MAGHRHQRRTGRHAPPLARAELDDATAFDAYVRIDTPDGPGFLAIETKYTEPFSPTAYPAARYRAIAEGPGGWFTPGSSEAASSSATNQLWRNTLLAQSTAAHYPDYGIGRVVVLTLAGDRHAATAVAGIRAALQDPDQRLCHVTLDQVVKAALTESELEQWARIFAARYLLE